MAHEYQKINGHKSLLVTQCLLGPLTALMVLILLQVVTPLRLLVPVSG